MAKVFLSYSSADRPFVAELRQRLVRDGVQCFYDQESISWGENWVMALERGIDLCDYVVVVLSPDYCRSEWAIRELTSAMLGDSANLKHKLRPLLLKPCPDMPRFLRPIQHINVSSPEKFEANYAMIYQQLRGDLSKTQSVKKGRQLLPNPAPVGDQSRQLHTLSETTQSRLWITLLILLGYILVLLFGYPLLRKVVPVEQGPFIVVMNVFLSLIAAITLFGFLKSTGFFRTRWFEFGGAAVFFIACLWYLNAAHAGTSMIKGIVYIDGQPQRHIRVELAETGKYTTTKESGVFEMEIPTGKLLDAVTFIVSPSESEKRTFRKQSSDLKQMLEFRLKKPKPEKPRLKEILGRVVSSVNLDQPVRGATIKTKIAKTPYSTRCDNKRGAFSLNIPDTVEQI